MWRSRSRRGLVQRQPPHAMPNTGNSLPGQCRHLRAAATLPQAHQAQALHPAAHTQAYAAMPTIKWMPCRGRLCRRGGGHAPAQANTLDAGTADRWVSPCRADDTANTDTPSRRAAAAWLSVLWRRSATIMGVSFRPRASQPRSDAALLLGKPLTEHRLLQCARPTGAWCRCGSDRGSRNPARNSTPGHRPGARAADPCRAPDTAQRAGRAPRSQRQCQAAQDAPAVPPLKSPSASASSPCTH